MKNKKVLILYAPVGMGHPMAAWAIEEAFNRKYPEIEVKNLSVLDFARDLFKNGLPKMYNLVSSRSPLLYKWAYNFYEQPSRQKFLHQLSQIFIKKSKFIPFLKDFSPDFILATHPLPMQLVSLTKQKNIIDILSANVCTDFGCHSFWYNLDVNYYFVAGEEVKKCLAGYGVAAEKIKVTGIPIGLKFSRPIFRQQILEQLQLRADQPMLLIIGGQLPCDKLLKIVKGIKEKNRWAQFIVVAGRDENLQKKLGHSSLKNDPAIRLFGLVDNLEELMTVADLVLSKAGGVTVAECLAKNLPMIIYKIIPGQEEDNVDYLVSHGAAVRVRNTEEIVETVVDLFSEEMRIEEMKKNCQKIARPQAAIDLADFVAGRIKDRTDKTDRTNRYDG